MKADECRSAFFQRLERYSDRIGFGQGSQSLSSGRARSI